MRATEFLTENMSRRGFLGALGAGAMAAGGVQAAPNKQYKPQPQEPINVLSMNTNAEVLLQRAARAAGRRLCHRLQLGGFAEQPIEAGRAARPGCYREPASCRFGGR